MDYWKNFKKFLKLNKEGLLIGGGVGAIAAFYLKSQGINLLAAAYQKGLIDVVMSRSAPVDIAFAKLLVVAVVVGAFIGAIADTIITSMRK